MQLIKWILGSKLTAIIGLVAAFLGLLNNPEFAGVIPQDWAAWAAGAGVLLATLARSLVDADGNGVPDLIDRLLGRDVATNQRGVASIAVVLALASVGMLALLACTPAFAKVSPGVSLEVAADSILVTYGCDGDAPNVACLATIADSATGAVLVSNVRLNFGQPAALAPRFCTSSGRVAFIGTFVGVTASGRQSPPVTVISGGTCDLAGGAVRPTINVQIRPGGL